MNGIVIGARSGGNRPQVLDLRRVNRHGLIAGATGTGKTVTLQGIVEGLSSAGVPCFVADVKGDLAGLGMAGSATARTHTPFAARAADLGLVDWHYRECPVQLWDLFGEQGHPVRTTVSDMGPLLLGRLLGLNEVQEGVLAIAFHVADEEGLLLLDLDDLQAMLVACGKRAEELTLRYGNVAKTSIGAIQRSLLQLRAQGGELFFGEPALALSDLMTRAEDGRGIVNILAADKLMASPRIYATFLLWLLAELFEQLPEVGDVDVPKLCFFFDEAHLLFDDAPPGLLEKVEQVVRLIRSKGVGVFFITQNPVDVPDKVAGQLGNRIQHALRAFTPRDHAAVKSAAETFRRNPDVDVTRAITELKVGEALVSLLLSDGSPAPVERILIRPPASRVGPLTMNERRMLVETDAIGDRYNQALDRESAEEVLGAKAADRASEAAQAKAEQAAAKEEQQRLKAEAAARREEERRAREAARPTMFDKAVQSAARSAASSIGRQLGNRLLRGVLGSLLK